MKDIASIMIKLADEGKGDVRGKKINKELTDADKIKMKEAVELSRKILEKIGVPREKQFLGTLNAGHPESMGNPPILTIMALARRIAKVITL